MPGGGFTAKIWTVVRVLVTATWVQSVQRTGASDLVVWTVNVALVGELVQVSSPWALSEMMVVGAAHDAIVAGLLRQQVESRSQNNERR